MVTGAVVVGAALMGGGAAYSAYNQINAAKNSRRMAKLTHRATLDGLGIQREMSTLAFEEAKEATRFIALAGKAEKVSAETESVFLEFDAVLQAKGQLDQVGVLKEDGEDLIALQTLSTVKSGVDLSGSALLVIEESRENLYKDEMEALTNISTGLRIAKLKANILKNQGKTSELLSNVQANSALFEARMTKLSSDMNIHLGSSQAGFDRASAFMNARTQKQQAIGNLVSGIGSAVAVGAT